MKKIFRNLAIVAVAALGLTACENDINEQIKENEGTVTVEVIADAPATRSQFGGVATDGEGNKYYPSTWTGGETVGFSLNEADIVAAENGAEAGVSATFSVQLIDDSTTEGSIYAFAPYYVAEGNDYTQGGFSGLSVNFDSAYVTIPANQTPIEGSVDPAAHLMAATINYTNGIPSTIDTKFEHIVAYGKMTIKEFEPGVENIKEVKVSLASNVLASKSGYYYYAGEKVGSVEKSKTESNHSTELCLDATNVDSGIFWFGCLPTDGYVTEGDLVVTITTGDDKVYRKSVELSSTKKLGFAQGKVSSFSVSMEGVVAEGEAPEGMEYVYTLVTSLDDLVDGDYVIVGRTSTKVAALSANGTSAPNLDDVIIVGNTLDESTIDATSILTMTKVEGGYQFVNNGKNFYCTNNNNGLKFGTNDNITWTIAMHINGSTAFEMMNVGQKRYVGIYNNQDWRSYDSSTANNYNAAAGTSELYFYKKTVQQESGLTKQQLSFDVAEYTLVYGLDLGDQFSPPTLSGANTAVTYESSNVEIATVAANGVVTFAENAPVGTVVITATAAEDETYAAASARYTITIEKAVVNSVADMTWEATDYEAQTITLEGKHLDKDGVVVKINEPENFTCTLEGLVLTVVPKADNETEENIVNTLQIRVVRVVDEQETTIGEGRNVTLTQKKKAVVVEGIDEIVFQDLSYANAAVIETVKTTNATLTFSKGEGNNAPTYYTSGSAIRIYQNNTFTISSEKTIEKVEFTFVSNSYNNIESVSVGTYEGGVWTGSANTITFNNITNDNKQTRIVSMKIYYGGESGGETPEPEPEVTPLATPVVSATASGNTITVSWGAVEGAASYSVQLGTNEAETTTENQMVFSDLEYGTKYSFSVVAKPAEDSTQYSDSAAGSASTTTETDPNAGTASLSFADTAQRTEFSTEKQVWEQNGVTLTNVKGSSTSNVADYSNPVRFYKNSTLEISHTSGKMTQIVFTCSSSAYATDLKNSIGDAATVSGSVVTVVFATPAASFTCTLSVGQVRMNKLDVTYQSN